MANANETDGNGAREKIEEYFDQFVFMDDLDTDHFLVWLYTEGYKVVPVEEITKFTDAELRNELHRRAMEFLGDQTKGVTLLDNRE